MTKLEAQFLQAPANRRERRILEDLRLEPERRLTYCEARNRGANILEAVHTVTETIEAALTLYGREDPGDLGY